MIILNNQYGTVTLTDDVFRNIAGDAATRCFGVKGMAGRAAKDGIVMLLRRETMSKGVSVIYHEEDGSITIQLHIVVDHGVNIRALSKSITKEVSYKVTLATGVPVRSVDIFVDSMLCD